MMGVIIIIIVIMKAGNMLTARQFNPLNTANPPTPLKFPTKTEKRWK